ncbi:calcium-binding protein [Jannaschia sp. M317]|uniref:calcium-binding protein n=1 Tax=Jannaschia sp. M317 TaxID=2867011 RepID=UPI0021A3D6B8|nr:calcium-binding protein [Jannaschia sp. M317]
MTLTLTGTPFQIDGGGRPRTFEVNGNIVQLWFEADFPTARQYGERMFVTVLASDGTVLIERTSLGDALDFDVAPNGFGQNAFHVTEGAGGSYVIHYSAFTNGFVRADGSFAAYAENRHTVEMGAGGALGTPVTAGAGFVKFEDSDTVTLSTGNVALLTRATSLGQVQLQILSPGGEVQSSRALEGSFDTGGIFAQVSDGLEVLEVAGRILTLYRDPASQSVYGQFSTLDGAAAQPEFAISGPGHGDASNAAVWLDGVIDAEVLTNGNIAVVWADSRTGSDGTEVWLKILSPAGATVKAETLANTGATAGEQFHPRVHALDSGGFVVTFDQNFAPNTDPAGYARQYDAAGDPVGGLVSFGGGTTNGSGGYGQILDAGYGLLIDWDGTVQRISVDGAMAPMPEPTSGAGGGTPGDDVLDGDDEPNRIEGIGGNDLIRGGAGGDTLDGGNGVDTLVGGAGDDVLTGGTSMADLRDVIFGGEGNDTIDGGYGNDALRGDAGNDQIAGGFGADTVIGGAGNDTLTGSAFGDEIFGGDGMDFVNGGFGSDRVNGGADADSFLPSGHCRSRQRLDPGLQRGRGRRPRLWRQCHPRPVPDQHNDHPHGGRGRRGRGLCHLSPNRSDPLGAGRWGWAGRDQSAAERAGV